MIRELEAHISERYVLGAVLSFAEDLREQTAELREELFAVSAHRRVFQAVALLMVAGRSPNVMAVASLLHERGQLESVGGMSYLAELCESAPHPMDLAGHLEQMRRAATLRQLAGLAKDMRARIDDPTVEADAILEHASTRLLEVAAEAGADGPKRSKALTESALKLLRDLDAAPEGILGATTGLPLLDYMTRGIQPGQLWYIGARPAVGKSSFALQMMLAQANRKEASTFFSLEMDAERLMHRLWARASLVDLRRANRGPNEIDRLNRGLEQVMTAPIRIDDARRGLNVAQMRARLASIHRSEPQACAFLDYLGLLRLPDADRHDLRVAAASWALKGLARELGIGVVALTQLNRMTESRNDRKPQLSDLRDSGSLEQDADVVIFLHQPRQDDPRTLELTIAKNREGPTGTLFLDVQREVGMFSQIERPS
jgi:replicative DNA helicase